MAVFFGETDMRKRSADHKSTTFYNIENSNGREQQSTGTLICLKSKKKSMPAKKSNSAQSPQSSGDDADKHMLRQTIHDLKVQLNQLVSEKGLADDSVLKHSQLLDQYIVKYQRLLLKSKSE